MDATLQRALEIAGWPEWEADGGRKRLELFGDRWHGVRLDGPLAGTCGGAMDEPVALAVIERHMREWLHERKIAVVWSNFAGQYVAKRWGSDMIEWKSELGPDYLAALAAAVVECVPTEASHA